MSDYNRYSNNNKRGGERFNRNPGGRPSFNRGGKSERSQQREMFPAVCDNCGKDCMVPFKPSGNKEIFCSNCFEKQGGNDRNSDRYDRRDYNKPAFERRDNRERDSWASNNDRSEKKDTSNSNADLKRQLDAINVKLNEILAALESKPKKVEVKAEKKEETTPKEKKPVKAKKATKKKAE